MKLIINIEKKHLYIIVGLIAIFSFLIIVNGAYVEHHWSDIIGGSPILASLKVTGNVEVDGELNASNGIKIGNSVGNEGLIRWNSTIKLMEIHNGTDWTNITSIKGGNSTISSTDCYWSGWFCGALLCNPSYIMVGFNGNTGANEACYGSGDWDLESKRIYCCKLL